MSMAADPFALLVAGSSTQHGGVGMRWRALHRALGRSHDCRVYEIACDRWNRCRQACLAEERPLPTGPGQDGELHTDWYHDRAYCDRYADSLVHDLRRADVSTVVFSGLDTYRYLVVFAAQPDFHVVYDMHNVEAPLQWAIRAALPVDSPLLGFCTEEQEKLLESAERAAVGAADELWTCTAQDEALTISTYPEAAGKLIRIIPNVVDVPQSRPDRRKEPSRVSFTGRMDYVPNLLASRVLAEEIAPLLAGHGCRLPVVVAGANLWPELFDPALLPNVRLVADPDTTADLIAGSVVAVPLTVGSGSRLKVLEAFALGAPVVSTAKGVEGLDVAEGVHYLRAETPEDFASAILVLIRDGRTRAGLVDAGWCLVRDRYSIEALGTRLEAVPLG
jgi:polysaccharide biosynthesis protein PslH